MHVPLMPTERHVETAYGDVYLGRETLCRLCNLTVAQLTASE